MCGPLECEALLGAAQTDKKSMGGGGHYSSHTHGQKKSLIALMQHGDFLLVSHRIQIVREGQAGQGGIEGKCINTEKENATYTIQLSHTKQNPPVEFFSMVKIFCTTILKTHFKSHIYSHLASFSS